MTRAPRITTSGEATSALDEAVVAFRRAVERFGSLDLPTTELVRLRCAEYHNCRACLSFRNEAAIAAGVDETVVRAIGRYEDVDLPERWKLTLRLVDAMIVDPAAVDDGLSAQLRAYFTHEQIAEIVFDVMKWSDRKTHVALGLDEAQHDGISSYSFDDAGRSVLGPPMDDHSRLYSDRRVEVTND